MEDTSANLLCKACGLCCSGHLFSWVRLNAHELDNIEKLGIKVIRADPRQRGFLQPCSMLDHGMCRIYTSLDYPRSCQKFKCQVLRRLLDNDISLTEGMTLVQETLDLIREIEPKLPESTEISFRERLIDQKKTLEGRRQELTALESDLFHKINKLLVWYIYKFGVEEFIDYEA